MSKSRQKLKTKRILISLNPNTVYGQQVIAYLKTRFGENSQIGVSNELARLICKGIDSESLDLPIVKSPIEHEPVIETPPAPPVVEAVKSPTPLPQRVIKPVAEERNFAEDVLNLLNNK